MVIPNPGKLTVKINRRDYPYFSFPLHVFLTLDVLSFVD